MSFGGPGFEPEASQLLLPKRSKIPKTSPPKVVSEMPSRLDRRAPDDAMKHFGIDPDEGRAVPDVFAGNVPLAGVSHRSSPAIGGRCRVEFLNSYSARAWFFCLLVVHTEALVALPTPSVAGILQSSCPLPQAGVCPEVAGLH